MSEATEKLLLDVKEVAKLTGISIGTLYHWVSEGRIPVVRLSARCIRFRRSDLDVWIAAKLVDIDSSGGTSAGRVSATGTPRRGEPRS